MEGGLKGQVGDPLDHPAALRRRHDRWWVKKWLYKIRIYDLVGSSCGAGDGRGHRDAGLWVGFAGEAAKGGLVTWTELHGLTGFPFRLDLCKTVTCSRNH